jgi:hypothetical protein
MKISELITDARSLLSDVTDLSYEEEDMLTWANLACSDFSATGVVTVSSSTTEQSVTLSNCIAVLNCFVDGKPIYHAEMGEVDFLSPTTNSAPSAWNYDGSILRFDNNNSNSVKYLYRKRLGMSEYTTTSDLADALVPWAIALSYYIAYRALLADKDDRAGQYLTEYISEKMIAAGMRSLNDQGPDEVKT